MISCLENSPCTIRVSFWLCWLGQNLFETFNLHFRNDFGPTEKQKLQGCPSAKLFVFDFNTLFHKNQMCFATCADSARPWPTLDTNDTRQLPKCLERPNTRFYRFESYELFATSVQAPFLLFASLICYLLQCHKRSISWEPSDFSALTFRWPYDSLKCLKRVCLLPGRRTSLPSSLKWQIASDTV
ncbi:hypothetical protein TNCV_2920851 [Trichonephila clavipes]|nr:hypothetical protein TNCV_2920851 [Trichonephila clavipes]